jgi:radical SAM protein with 4Fe4S-binding SPASM domain
MPLDDYFKMPGYILDFVHQAESRRIAVHIDNAVPLCVFDYSQMGELLLKGVIDLDRNSRCKPIIDIGPDLSVWPCFCLSPFDNRQLDEFDNLAELQEHYSRQLAPYQDKVFPMERCYDCDLRKKWGCQGGCTVFSMERAVEPPTGLTLTRSTDKPAQHTEELRGTGRLCLVDGVTVRRYEIPFVQFVLSDVNGKSLELGQSFAKILEGIDVGRSLPELCHEILPDPDADDLLGCFEAGVMRENFEKLLYFYIEEGFLQLESAS